MRPNNRRGQFIPITGIVMFTVVVFMLALTNVYFVTRAKLQLQNLADAAALNLAAQQAQAFNLISDKNEWLNHMVAGINSPNHPTAPQGCEAYHGIPNQPRIIPPIMCVENGIAKGDFADLWPAKSPVFFRHIFNSRDGAINYGMVVNSVNQAQRMFVEAYNSFLGAPQSYGGAQSSNASSRNFAELLKKDIPDLVDPSIRLVAWNTPAGESRAQEAVASLGEEERDESFLESKMEPLKFEVERELLVSHYVHKSGSSHGYVEAATLSSLIYGCIDTEDYEPGDSKFGECGPLYTQPQKPVGWMRPGVSPGSAMPRMDVDGSSKVGVGVLVEKIITLPVLGTKKVSVKSKAYVVEAGDVWHPIYWVKLGK